MHTSDQGHARVRSGARGRWAAATVALVAAATLASACTGESNARATLGSTPTEAGTTSGTLAPAPVNPPPPLLDQAKVDSAVGKLDGVVGRVMSTTGVPGIAVAVVYQGKVVFAKGFGERDLSKPGEKVDENTRFELASVSKPLAATVVAKAVSDGKIKWDDPVVKYNPTFALKDPYVTSNVTFADLFAHRSGLPDHAGDLLEDLGYDRDTVIERLNQVPLDPFRMQWLYTNFGLTEAGVTAAKAAGSNWEQLSQDLYDKLGMTHTSSRFSDFEQDPDKAANHVQADGKWVVAKAQRNADAQSPAGGASSSVTDMAKWMQLQLDDGKLGNEQYISEEALLDTRLPQAVSGPASSPAARSGFYGLGFNVGYDVQGRLKLSHSGAFATGAATAVTLYPGEDLGIITLTNGAPVGAAEAVNEIFMDDVQYGHAVTDWLPFLQNAFQRIASQGRSDTDYRTPPPNAAPAKADTAYTGTYANSFYGPATIASEGGKLVLKAGAGQKLTFPLTHYQGDVFSFDTVGENAVGLTGLTFTVGPDGRASSFVVEAWDHEDLGTFTRT